MRIRRIIVHAVLISMLPNFVFADGITCSPSNIRDFATAPIIIRGVVKWSSRNFLILRVSSTLKGRILLPIVLIPHSLCMGDPSVAELSKPGRAVMVFVEDGIGSHSLIYGDLWPDSGLSKWVPVHWDLREIIRQGFLNGLKDKDPFVVNSSMDGLIAMSIDGLVGKEDPESLTQIEKLTQSSDNAVREHAMKSMRDAAFWKTWKAVKKKMEAPNHGIERPAAR